MENVGKAARVIAEEPMNSVWLSTHGARTVAHILNNQELFPIC